jgi:hypothetical protein
VEIIAHGLNDENQKVKTRIMAKRESVRKRRKAKMAAAMPAAKRVRQAMTGPRKSESYKGHWGSRFSPVGQKSSLR